MAVRRLSGRCCVAVWRFAWQLFRCRSHALRLVAVGWISGSCPVAAVWLFGGCSAVVSMLLTC
eukprot:8111628-Lingulodinium_polyedra.AAC.1